ncbi:DUF4129 domain-containing protein [Microbacterium sp. ZW T5_56]|uniref:DUF4129 domain-containing protein n=1 Tax=Microbacterium sp. ZW T5_56 TaxID=3378081 RepID=UPI003851A92E
MRNRADVIGFSEIPLLPDPDEARSWLEDELAKPAYAEAQPTWFDQMAKAISDFISGILNPQIGPGGGMVVAAIIGVLIVAIIVAAIIVWGVPRTRASSRLTADDLLFGEEESRTATELRRAAQQAAAAGDYDEAVILRFRALARGLSERGAVRLGPGATVHAFAAQASAAFPTEVAELSAAADVFDAVRYLRQPGTPEAFDGISRTDERLERSRPVALPELTGAIS